MPWLQLAGSASWLRLRIRREKAKGEVHQIFMFKLR